MPGTERASPPPAAVAARPSPNSACSPALSMNDTPTEVDDEIAGCGKRVEVNARLVDGELVDLALQPRHWDAAHLVGPPWR